MNISSLATLTRLLLFSVLFITAVVFAKPFLIPLTLAAILAMLFAPVSTWLEDKKVPRFLAAGICTLIFLAVVAGILGLISWQVSDFAKDAQQMKAEIMKILGKLETFLQTKLGIPVAKQQESLSAIPGNLGDMAISTAGSILGLLVDWVLLVVYIVLLIYFRHHIRVFVLKVVPGDEKNNTDKILKEAGMVAQQYLTGLAKMVVTLWVLYGIAFSAIGVKSAIFFAVLCGLLEIVPFVGSLMGCSLTALMVLAQGGSGGMLAGVVISYASIQLVQSYVLEPLVVGSTVRLNALFTIIALVLGEMIWGVPGMILAIPMVGIFKIVCDHIDPLKPVGFLVGEIRTPKGEIPLVARVKKWWQDRKAK